MSVDLQIVPPEGWADRVADELVARLRDNPRLRLCLPTGSTPTPLYEALARRTDARWAGAEIILLDEYVGLDEGDPARGGDRLRRELIDRLPEAPAAFHEIDTEAQPDEAAARHDAVAARGIDLTVVGIGLNGHIGFNEPGTDADGPTAVVDLAATSRSVATDTYGAGESPERGITLGMRRILDSGEVWLLVTGESKAAILARALEGPESIDCPASLLRRHPALRVYADEPAASRLTA